MANVGSKISGYPTMNVAASNSSWLVVEHSNGTSNVNYKIAITDLFANATSNVTFANNTLSVNNFILRRTDTPANSTITVTKGTMWFDDTYLYVATANNTIKRLTLSSF